MILQKLLQRGQERDKFLAEVRQREEPDHVLELKQTIQIMQEKLDEREGEAFCTFKPSHWLFISQSVGPTFDSIFFSFVL